MIFYKFSHFLTPIWPLKIEVIFSVSRFFEKMFKLIEVYSRTDSSANVRLSGNNKSKSQPLPFIYR